jgi:predicted GNAT family acetyltransferase
LTESSGPGTEPRVADNPAEEQYEVRVGDALAGTLAYALDTDRITLIHTEVDPAFEGQGLGSKLAAAALDDARARGLRVVVECPFVLSYVRRHRDRYADLLEPRRRR